jgi:hypothetical protein
MSSQLDGSCLCGAIEYTVADDSHYALICHCSQCRRATGAAHKPFAGIVRDRLTVTSGGTEVLRYGNEGNHDVRRRQCGSFSFSVVRDGEYVHVALGSLSDSPTIRPSAHMFVGSKA